MGGQRLEPGDLGGEKLADELTTGSHHAGKSTSRMVLEGGAQLGDVPCERYRAVH